jgi:LPS export ABC transporter protein LptC/lipopolysaccharide transport protein LptA
VLFSILADWETSRPENNGVSEKSSLQESYFKDIRYYILRDKQKLLQLKASDLTINDSHGKIFFYNPVGTVYTSAQEAVEYEGKKGLLMQKKNELFLEEDVVIKTANSQMDSDQVNYFLEKEMVKSTGSVKTKTYNPKTKDKIFIDADEVTSWTKKEYSFYDGNVKGHIKRARNFEENIYFSSNKLYLDMVTSLVTLNENVFLKKQGIRARSHRGEVFLENYNKNLKYFVLYDDVRVKEKVKLPGRIVSRRAYAEKLEGIMSEDIVILTGYPKVYQDKDVIKGNRIILRVDNEVVEVDDANTRFLLK